MLDFMQTEPRFYRWLHRHIRHEHPSKAIQVIHFGVRETEKGYAVYLMGQERFDEEGTDWLQEPWDFVPGKQVFEIGPEIKSKDGWEAAVIRIRSLLLDFMKTDTYQESFFARVKAITLGFEGSDELLRLR